MGLFFVTPQAVASTTPFISPVVQTIEERVTEVYKDPRMVTVLRCESGLKQFDSQRKPLLSKTSDVGISQINQVHWKEAKKLGLDIFNSESDNLKMGKLIYDSEGITAWTCFK